MTKPAHQLVRSSDYFRSVLGNMGGPKSRSRVRFGTEGDGVAPNYEIVSTNGKAIAFRGLSHRPNIDVDRYDEANLSSHHTYAEVQELLAGCLAKTKR